jgi:Zn-dependent protease with chaperone function
MNLLPSVRTRYVLLFVCLLAVVALVEALAKAVVSWGDFGFAVTLWACFGVAYAWLLIEPSVRGLILKQRVAAGRKQHRVRRIGAEIAAKGGVHPPRFYVYDGSKFDVMVSGIGKGVTILVSESAARLDDATLRSVLAHEFGHIRLRHALIRLTMYGSLLSLAIIGHSTAAVAVPANFFVLWTMRQMEFAADRDAARLVGFSDMMAALRAMGDAMGDIPSWQTAVSTHPSFRSRIARLEDSEKTQST